jgi:hypothetical protein
MESLCTHIIRDCIKPFGVVSHCEIHANNEVISTIVDGEVENLTNYWCTSGLIHPPESLISFDEIYYDENDEDMIISLEEDEQMNEMNYYNKDWKGFKKNKKRKMKSSSNKKNDIEGIEPGLNRSLPNCIFIIK